MLWKLNVKKHLIYLKLEPLGPKKRHNDVRFI